MDKTSLTLGWLAGRRIAGQRTKKPIAYLYNGVQAPDINAVWTDKETYPYAFVLKGILISGEEVLELNLHGKQAVVDRWAGDVLISPEDTVISYRITGDGDEWQFYSETNTGSLGFVGNTASRMWSNYDIYYAEDYSDETLAGTLYLSASDPIPVYA